MKKAAIYARVSTDQQGKEDKVSIESQLAQAEAYAKERGYTVVARFVDKEKYRVKGKLVQPSSQRKDRPGYVAMLKAARAGHFDVIIAWKEDRLYRGMYAAMPLSELLDEKGKALDIELVKDTFDRKMLGIKAALGKIEIDNMKDRMIMGRKGRLEKSLTPGGNQVKYGYKKVDRRLVIEETEAKIVKQIFAWYIAGENNMQIRRRLNASEIAPRKAKLWPKHTITKILDLEAYATGKMPTTIDGETFYIDCPPIIDMDTWEKAKRIKAGNKSKPKHVKHDYLCTGLVYCVCGWKSFPKAVSRRGYISGYYYCHHPDVHPEECPKDCYKTMGSKKLDEIVWEYVKFVCKNTPALKDKIDQKLKELKEEQRDLETEINRLQAKLDDLLMERQRIITWGRKQIITEEDMGLQLDTIELQQLVYKKELNETLAVSEAQGQIEDLQAWKDEYLADLNRKIEQLDIDLASSSEEDMENLYTELEAWRFEEKGDKLSQLKWAILEKKQQTVKALISRVVVGKFGSGKGRTIQFYFRVKLPINCVVLGDKVATLPTKETHYLTLSFSSDELTPNLLKAEL